MRRAVLGGLLCEGAFQAALVLFWCTGSMAAVIAVGAVTGFAAVRFLACRAAFRPLKDTLLWLGAGLAAHLLTDAAGVTLCLAGWCMPSIRAAGGFSAAEGLAVLLVTAAFAAAVTVGYGMGLLLLRRKR